MLFLPLCFLLNKGNTTWNGLCQQRILLEKETERVCVGWASKVLFIDSWHYLALGRSVLGQILQKLEPEMNKAVCMKRNYATCEAEKSSLQRIKKGARSLLWKSGGVMPQGGGHFSYEGIIQQMMQNKWSFALIKPLILVDRRQPGFSGVTSFAFPSSKRQVLFFFLLILVQFCFLTISKNAHAD